MTGMLELLLYAFGGGLAIQQTLEVLDGILPGGAWQTRKKLLFKLIAMASGMIGAFLYGPLSLPWSYLECFVFGAIMAATTETWNSVSKALTYIKETRKAEASKALSTAGTLSLEDIARK
jgi:hypothetical protein